MANGEITSFLTDLAAGGLPEVLDFGRGSDQPSQQFNERVSPVDPQGAASTGGNNNLLLIGGGVALLLVLVVALKR